MSSLANEEFIVAHVERCSDDEALVTWSDSYYRLERLPLVIETFGKDIACIENITNEYVRVKWKKTLEPYKDMLCNSSEQEDEDDEEGVRGEEEEQPQGFKEKGEEEERIDDETDTIHEEEDETPREEEAHEREEEEAIDDETDTIHEEEDETLTLIIHEGEDETPGEEEEEAIDDETDTIHQVEEKPLEEEAFEEEDIEAYREEAEGPQEENLEEEQYEERLMKEKEEDAAKPEEEAAQKEEETASPKEIYNKKRKKHVLFGGKFRQLSKRAKLQSSGPMKSNCHSITATCTTVGCCSLSTSDSDLDSFRSLERNCETPLYTMQHRAYKKQMDKKTKLINIKSLIDSTNSAIRMYKSNIGMHEAAIMDANLQIRIHKTELAKLQSTYDQVEADSN